MSSILKSLRTSCHILIVFDIYIYYIYKLYIVVLGCTTGSRCVLIGKSNAGISKNTSCLCSPKSIDGMMTSQTPPHTNPKGDTGYVHLVREIPSYCREFNDLLRSIYHHISVARYSLGCFKYSNL